MPKRPIPALIGDRVRLRPLDERDLPMTLAWRNQDHIRRWFIFSDVITPERHGAWFDRYRARDDDFLFIIEERDADSRPVGQASLYAIDWAAGRAEYGRLLIGEPTAARGLAMEATQLLLRWAFDTLGLTHIELAVYRDNAAAIRMYRACGFHRVAEKDGLLMLARGPND